MAKCWRTASIAAPTLRPSVSLISDFGAYTRRPSSPARRAENGVMRSATEARHMPQCPRAISPRSCTRLHSASPQKTRTHGPPCDGDGSDCDGSPGRAPSV
eukprot:scaffold165777_cov33-Tisochrysis_lutea.AAC.2